MWPICRRRSRIGNFDARALPARRGVLARAADPGGTAGPIGRSSQAATAGLDDHCPSGTFHPGRRPSCARSGCRSSPRAPIHRDASAHTRAACRNGSGRVGGLVLDGGPCRVGVEEHGRRALGEPEPRCCAPAGSPCGAGVVLGRAPITRRRRPARFAGPTRTSLCSPSVATPECTTRGTRRGLARFRPRSRLRRAHRAQPQPDGDVAEAAAQPVRHVA